MDRLYFWGDRFKSVIVDKGESHPFYQVSSPKHSAQGVQWMTVANTLPF